MSSTLKPIDNPYAFSSLDTEWSEKQIEGVARILREKGAAEAVAYVSAGQPDRVRVGLNMLMKIADMPEPKAPDKLFELLAADMLLHRANNLGQDEVAALYRFNRELIARRPDPVPYVAPAVNFLRGSAPRCGQDLMTD